MGLAGEDDRALVAFHDETQVHHRVFLGQPAPFVGISNDVARIATLPTASPTCVWARW